MTTTAHAQGTELALLQAELAGQGGARLLEVRDYYEIQADGTFSTDVLVVWAER